MAHSVATRIAHALTVSGLLTVTPAIARAQAFVPAQGEGAVSIVFQNQFFKYHRAPVRRLDVGPIWANSLLADVTYGVTDKVAVSLALPWVATRYRGPTPHPYADFSGPNPVDNGTWHATAQDFRFDMRYNVTRNLWNAGIVLTPFIGSIAPSHEYTYFAHAGFGRDLKELQIGTSAAKLFERGIPGLILQGRYAYGVREQVLDISHNRSLISMEVGYFVTPKFRLLALGTGERTHGGIDFPGIAAARAFLTTDQIVHHDQISRENNLILGAGASYSINESIDFFGSFGHAVIQRNGHELDRGVTAGVSWSFSTRRAKNRAAGDLAENSLAKCLCEKGANK